MRGVAGEKADLDAGPVLAPVELRLEGFQGPIGVLLSLIERRKLPITAISLAQVTDQYLAYVRGLPQLDPDLLADFLVVAGKLLLVKSRAILPTEAEPSGDEEDPSRELAERLQEYRLVRAAAQYLQGLEQQGLRAFPHPPRDVTPLGSPPLQPIRASELAAALSSLLARRARSRARTAEVERLVRASVEARMQLITDLLQQRALVDWPMIAGRSVDEAIATFLALLEMLKRGLIRVEQAEPFGAIVVMSAAG